MQKLVKTPEFSVSFKNNSKLSDLDDQSNFSSMPKSCSFNLSPAKCQGVSQNEEKLEKLKQKFFQLKSSCYIEKLKLNEEFHSVELENSMIKNEILNLESQIIETKSIIYSVGKNQLDKEKQGMKELENRFRNEKKFNQVEKFVFLKNIDSNLQYVHEKLEIAQNKTSKSRIKLERTRNDYAQKISAMNAELKSIQTKIESLESEYFQLSCTLRDLQYKNSSLSSKNSSKNSKLNSLKHKSQELFLTFSSLRSKINKKPIN